MGIAISPRNCLAGTTTETQQHARLFNGSSALPASVASAPGSSHLFLLSHPSTLGGQRPYTDGAARACAAALKVPGVVELLLRAAATKLNSHLFLPLTDSIPGS